MRLQGNVAPAIFWRMNQGLKQAIEIAGSQNKLAQLLGITHQAVNKWRLVPTHHLIKVEQLTGVHRSLLRPDLYTEPGQNL
jgi:DNA-binding transcriptional regulator YdaS (Cro superfamily)